MELNLMQIKEEELHQLDNVLSIFKHLNNRGTQKSNLQIEINLWIGKIAFSMGNHQSSPVIPTNHSMTQGGDDGLSRERLALLDRKERLAGSCHYAMRLAYQLPE